MNGRYVELADGFHLRIANLGVGSLSWGQCRAKDHLFGCGSHFWSHGSQSWSEYPEGGRSYIWMWITSLEQWSIKLWG